MLRIKLYQRGSQINLLDFLNTIATCGNCVKRLDDIVLPIADEARMKKELERILEKIWKV